jgi:hypothetical protein
VVEALHVVRDAGEIGAPFDAQCRADAALATQILAGGRPERLEIAIQIAPWNVEGRAGQAGQRAQIATRAHLLPRGFVQRGILDREHPEFFGSRDDFHLRQDRIQPDRALCRRRVRCVSDPAAFGHRRSQRQHWNAQQPREHAGQGCRHAVQAALHRSVETVIGDECGYRRQQPVVLAHGEIQVTKSLQPRMLDRAQISVILEFTREQAVPRIWREGVDGRMRGDFDHVAFVVAMQASNKVRARAQSLRTLSSMRCRSVASRAGWSSFASMRFNQLA